MLRNFLPTKHVNSTFEITPKLIKKMGKKGILVDLDNTLVPWNVANATEEVEKWLYSMLEADIKVVVFSNNNSERVSIFAEPLNIPFINDARKPLRKAFIYACQLMGLNKEEVVVIGDQLLTDVLGGNRVGLDTILVVPLVQSDAPITKFNRRIERMILNRFYKQGKLTRRMHNEN